jgi:hypothetical protein
MPSDLTIAGGLPSEGDQPPATPWTEDELPRRLIVIPIGDEGDDKG